MRHSRRKQLLDDLRDHVRNAVPFDLTFAPCGKMPKADKERLEDHLRYHFRLWADTWILPWIDMIEKRWLGKAKEEPPEGNWRKDTHR
jgi:hypothetical protein